MSIHDIIAALGVLFDSLPQGLLAMFYGFAALPTAIGFGIAAIGALIWGLPTPVSFQAETTILAGGLGKNAKERISIIVIAGIVMLVLGTLSMLGAIVNFIGKDILNGMLAGVGVILVKASLDVAKENKYCGIASFAVAIPVYFFTKNLIYACVSSVVIASVVNYVLSNYSKNGKSKESTDKYNTEERIKFVKPIFNPQILRGALAVIMLQIGGNISYGTITAGLANATPNVDKLSILGGSATAASGFFGGAPLAAIISATATAPHPVTAGVLLMALAAIVLASRAFYYFAKLVPVSAVAGYLFVLGAFLVFPPYIAEAMGGNTLVSGVTAVVTATTDPFIGMLAGIAIRLFSGLV